MPFAIKTQQKQHLIPVTKCDALDILVLCKTAFDYLSNGPDGQDQIYQMMATKYQCNTLEAKCIQQSVEALISLLIEATKANVSEDEVQQPLTSVGFSAEAVEILSQFMMSKRSFIEGSIKTANIRSYRLVNLEWRLEVRLATRSLLKQSQIIVTMKLYLHTEPKNENRDLLEYELKENATENTISEEEKRNRKDLLVQTDLNSLVHIIQSLEEALMESKTRRIRNIVNAIH